MSYPNKAELYGYLDLNPFATVDEIHKHFLYTGKNPTRRKKRLSKAVGKWLTRREAIDLNKETVQEPVIGGVIEAPEDVRGWASGTTFIFTSAQANTHLNEKFWNNLMHFAEVRDAQVHISRFTYNKAQFGKKSVKPDADTTGDDDDIWFDPRIEPYISDEQIQIADGLIWCGELNIIPTRVDPINGFENYGRGASVIIPHTKMAMKSVPTMKDSPARFAYSTGTVTARNYIEKAAGQKASLHHVYGALLVEVDEDGTWFARQLNADNDGTIYDLNQRFGLNENGKIGVTESRVRVLTHGDLHGNKVNRSVLRTMEKVIDVLHPEHQVFHDTIDFQPRNHHNIKDSHFLHQMLMEGKDVVEDEFKYIAILMGRHLARPDTRHHIVTSNHDQAVEGWLRNVSGFNDPVNLKTWLMLNLYCVQSREDGKKPRPFWNLLSKFLPKQYNWQIVHEDDSLVIAGIEHGLHGHLGPNGARGSPKNLRTVGKANTGHTHSAGIVEGVYTAGVFGDLDMGYNKGLSGWSHSFIVTYQNGKRAIMTIKNRKAWR